MHLRPFSSPRQRAFSLIEVLVALMILSVLAVVMVGAIPSAMIAMKKSENRTKAAVLASTTIECLRKTKFDEIKSGMNLSAVTKFHAQTEAQQWARTDYTIDVETGTAYSAGLPLSDKKAKGVKVIVRWKDKQGDSSYSAHTILFKEP